MKGSRMATSSVERSIWIKAPIERVYAAIAEPEQLGQWILPPSMGAGLARTGSNLAVSMGPMAIDYAALEGLQPPTKISLRSIPDKLIAANFTLAAENGGTRVSVAVSGLDSLSEAAAQDRLGPLGAAWDKALQNLKAFVDGSALPHPEGWSAALFGYRREGGKTASIERSIWIKAPIERVWTAITQPDQIGQWFSPGMEWRGSGPVVGGVLSMVDPATQVETPLQIIDVVEAPKRLVTHSSPESSESTTVSEWTLAAENGGTRLTLTFSGVEPRGNHDMIEQNAFGFGMMMQNIKAGIEGEALPFPGGF
jgi:uncharacterized protein YndB with AHSA1/START domain